MKKIAIWLLVWGLLPMAYLQAQSDFGLKQHLDEGNSQSSEILVQKSAEQATVYSLPFIQAFEGATFPPTDWARFIGTNGAGNSYNWVSTNSGQSGKGAFVD